MSKSNRNRREFRPSCVIELLEQRTLLNAVLLQDNFSGTTLNTTNWFVPDFNPDGSTFLGRTQLQLTQSPGSPFPSFSPPVSNGAVHMPLDTNNPTANTPGDSFFGSEIISQQQFTVGDGLIVDVTAQVQSTDPGGIVDAIFLYNPPDDSGNHDEIDTELVTNNFNQVQTNVYADQPLGVGSPTSVSLTDGGIAQSHTYQIMWLPNEIQWSVDGHVIGIETTTVPTGPMSLYINSWVPDSTWPLAYNANLQPTANAADNQVYNFNVSNVTVTQLTSPFVPTAATQVAFMQQPTNVLAGVTISPTITVLVEDSNGDVITSDNSTATLSIGNGPAGAVLGGTLSVSAVNGVATFSEITVNSPGNCTLIAGDGSLTGATSAGFVVTPPGWVDVANMNQISGWGFDPNDPTASANIEIDIAGGPSQTFSANETRSDLQPVLGSTNHGFTYSTPVLSVGSHIAYIYLVEADHTKLLLATKTLVSQNSLFDEHYYLAANPDVAAAVADGEFATGYDHYVQYGQFEGRSPSPYWDEAWYLQENPDVAAAVNGGTVTSGFMHYYLYGQFENRPGLLYFNTGYYLANNADVAAAVSAGEFSSAFEHFVLYGQYEGRSPMPYFSSAVYDADNQDIIPFVTGETFSSDFEQFVEFGQYEGRIASNNYNEQVYLSDNPDVAAAVLAGEFPDGFQHWLEYGQFEGRTAVN